MAFNFNWSPLIADTSRAKDMLTTALNKSPKPPIIVDDIVVTELNLGSTPPDLEILEIGDLAEDRFRGIFKMSYTGDAFLTLQTRVQANPLNTYLSTKPSFASPQPLAAASSLTIPLSITLSDFRLSGFVILVFSRQKGLTLVFRNDPLESLKVSSTFDSIPFVRNYLQKEIEGQLRVLFMEDLPAILHRLSLRLWSPDYQDLDDKETIEGKEMPVVDPLASPPQDPIDMFRDPADESGPPEWSLDNTETHASFSSRNILRLAALSESQKTLSLFTPSIQGAVFRAWAGAAERNETSGLHTPPLTLSALSRVNSSVNHLSSTVASSVSEGSDAGTLSSRPSISTSNSLYNNIVSGGARNRAGTRKRKKRVINLRRSTTDETRTPEERASSEVHMDAQTDKHTILDEVPEELHPSLRTPQRGVRFHERDSSLGVPDSEGLHITIPTQEDNNETPRPVLTKDHGPLLHHPKPTTPSKPALLPSASFEKLSWLSSHSTYSAGSSSRLPSALGSPITEESMGETAGSGGILEQAWMMKMAKEIAKKVAEQRELESRHGEKRSGSRWERGRHGVGEAPPAYVE